MVDEFLDCMMYIKGLEFEEKPNYEKMRNSFKSAYNKQGFGKEDHLMDWQIVRKMKKLEKKKGKEKE